jgi:hypothetical protein
MPHNAKNTSGELVGQFPAHTNTKRRRRPVLVDWRIEARLAFLILGLAT